MKKDRLLRFLKKINSARVLQILTYDDKGNMISQLESNEAGELNHRILRKFDENNNLIEIAVTIDRHGMGLNQNYSIHYSYEYFEINMTPDLSILSSK